MIRSNAPDSWIAKANLAFEAACRKVIDRARQSGTEIVIWRDGQIVVPTHGAINVQGWLCMIESNPGHR